MQRVIDLWSVDIPLAEPGESAWVLGREYVPDSDKWSSEFMADVEARVRLMYRTQFATPIPRHPDGPSPMLQSVTAFFRGPPSTASAAAMVDNSGFFSDVGWGCMIRTGQSLLANALEIAEFGRDQRPAESEEIKLLRKFSDEPGATYSIHRFVDYAGARCGKLPGQWFGPSAVSSCIASFLDESNLRVYVSNGMDVYEPEVLDGSFPVLILCGLRLGIQEINPVYYDGLRALFSAPQSVGIAGGRPGASLYFYGYQGARAFYHDPHEPRAALSNTTPDSEFLESTHSRQIRALPFAEMDPSMLAGVLLKDKNDYEQWKEHMLAVPPKHRAVIILSTKPPDDVSDFGGDEDEEEYGDTSSAKDSSQVV